MLHFSMLNEGCSPIHTILNSTVVVSRFGQLQTNQCAIKISNQITHWKQMCKASVLKCGWKNRLTFSSKKQMGCHCFYSSWPPHLRLRKGFCTSPFWNWNRWCTLGICQCSVWVLGKSPSECKAWLLSHPRLVLFFIMVFMWPSYYFAFDLF